MQHLRRAERHKRKRASVRIARFSRYLSPKYHWRKLVEDVKSAKAGLSMWQLDKAKSEGELRKAIRGKLFATFLAGTPIAGFGAPIGYGIQIATGNPLIGIYSGVLLANCLGLLAFQVVWATTNRAFYARRHYGLMARWKAMLEDLWPMQWQSIKIALVMNLFLLPLTWIIAAVMTWLFPQGIRYIPLGLVVSGAEAVFIQTTTLRLLGDLYERHARVLARKYSPTLDQAIEEC
ncbi:MAG: hypothetical protein JNK63_04315 [Chthonomonas sp.]|nr:hypothetical protein [Chthonomonas sp.]